MSDSCCKMKNRFLRMSILFSAVILISANPLLAEKLKPLNPDCDVCPVVISYEGEEAKRILGPEGTESLVKLIKIGKKTAKIDLDGVKRPGSESDSDNGYELVVHAYPHLVGISPIGGSSAIKIMTDFEILTGEGSSGMWSPEIQIQSSNHLEIEKTDDIEIAWEKVKGSEIYGFVNGGGQDHDAWNENLSKMIRRVLKAAAGE